MMEDDSLAEEAPPIVMGSDESRSPPLILETFEQSAVVDPGLARRLKQHQVEGVRWLFAAFNGCLKSGCRGGILGDGMGVGKSLQTLTLVHTLVDNNQAFGVLIVVPSSLVQNWQREVEKFTMAPHVMRPLPVTFVGDTAQCSHARLALITVHLHSPPRRAPRKRSTQFTRSPTHIYTDIARPAYVNAGRRFACASVVTAAAESTSPPSPPPECDVEQSGARPRADVRERVVLY